MRDNVLGYTLITILHYPDTYFTFPINSDSLSDEWQEAA